MCEVVVMMGGSADLGIGDEGWGDADQVGGSRCAVCGVRALRWAVCSWVVVSRAVMEGVMVMVVVVVHLFCEC